MCFDEIDDFDRLVPIYLAHANIVGVSADATRLELDAIPQLPVISGRRTRALFAEAGPDRSVRGFPQSLVQMLDQQPSPSMITPVRRK